jgi:hypothetical protein
MQSENDAGPEKQKGPRREPFRSMTGVYIGQLMTISFCELLCCGVSSRSR